ncbi:hypothetical protein ABW20_dc0103842 [Dactylellina cionopaga]|nr:hypothetical protein ABW20_dc0103842 [Dactylellina cionopaga]
MSNDEGNTEQIEEEWTPDYDLYYKMILCGDSQVGKSKLLIRSYRDEYEDGYEATTGLEFTMDKQEVDSKVLMVQVWDNAADSTPAMLRRFVWKALGVFLVYDITNPDTFSSIPERLQAIRDTGKLKPAAKITILGNKSDLKDGSEFVVTTEEAKAFADKNGFFFAEVSALDGSGVVEAFQNVVAAIREDPDLDGTVNSDPYPATDEEDN